MAFFECEFPTTISYRAMGGPGFFTTVNAGLSGYELRVANWADPVSGLGALGRWMVSLMTPPEFPGTRQQFIDLLLAFFLNVAGRSDGFRLRDHKDYKAVGQPVLGGGGVYQLAKNYVGPGGGQYTRVIQKPIAPPAVDYQGNLLPNTVSLYVNGVLQSSSSWSVDGTTGLVSFSSGGGGAITADFEFHYPVRFDSDELNLQIEESNVAGGDALVSWNAIGLVETRIALAAPAGS